MPETADEKINTVIRVRPGDNLVLAGLVSSSDTSNRQGIPLGNMGRIPGYSNDELENRELVVVVKPSVVLFSDKQALADARKNEENQPSEAVMIDKSGARTVNIPGTPATPAPVAMAPAPVAYTKPELMVPAGDAATTAPIPLTPSADGAPVDKRLMQRGFSHAFDQLLNSKDASTTVSGTPSP